ncbi:MAG: phosphonate ABC transporter, permease protein PhnE [Actinomycetota bacterium]|nr:phosphonate ABC transporter, permease protein PhnE [Dehalococcoidia bacterium]MEC7908843.1 phosphonate ABC transporter, permease protein PhnE [Actinomycetota bacterium]|tara:strand:+ start:894 stop:1694 length:801 start_codon:yes stop_codon:yes gene_type:complete
MNDHTNTSERPVKPKPRARSFLIALVLLALTFWAAIKVSFDISTFWEVWTNPIWGMFWPIPWDWVFTKENTFDPLIETLQIAVASTLLGCLVALPVSFAMSSLTTPNKVVYFISKTIMNLVRAVPDLFWAKLLVTAIGIGAFAGAWSLSIFSLAVMVKLFSETVDAADPRPLEAARSSGARHLPAVKAGVLPTVFPSYVAYSLYIFELNIRASVVLGLVGAGGVGRVIETQRQFFRFDRILGLLIIIFGIVWVIEQISVSLRKRLV